MPNTFSFEEASAAPPPAESSMRDQVGGGMGTNVGIIDENLRQIDQALATVKDPSARSDLQAEREDYQRQRARLVAAPEMAGGDQPSPAPAPSKSTFSFEEATGGQRSLPAGVKPSTAGAGRGSVNPGPEAVPSREPVTSSADENPGLAELVQSIPVASRPNGSVFDTQKMDAPTEDAAANRDAMRKSVSPDSVMFTAGRGLENADRIIARGPQATPAPTPAPSSGNLAKDLAINAFAGGAKTVLGAGATAAQTLGADDAAASLDEMRHNWEGVQAENGGGTIAGRAADLVGSVAPAFLVPAAKAAQLVGNAGLFALPAFRETLKSQLDAGRSFPLALAHAAEAFGVNLVMPTIATRGSQAVTKALGAADATGAKAVGTALGQAVGEGAAFSAANSALDKGTDAAFGQKNDRDWLDFQDMAANALGFSVLRGGHLAANAVAGGSPSEKVGRALGQDVDATQLDTSTPGVQTNPNLAQPDTAPASSKAPAKDSGPMSVADQLAAVRPLDQERIDRLRAAGEKTAADLLERRAGAARAQDELGVLAQAAPDHASDPVFQQSYQQQRAAGVKPAEAAGRAGMAATYGQLGQQFGITPKAMQAGLDAAAKMPLDKIPGFLERYTGSLATRGMGMPPDPGAITSALEDAGHGAMTAAADALYRPAETTQGQPDAATQPATEAAAPAAVPETAGPQAGGESPAPGADGARGTNAGEPDAPLTVDVGAHEAASSPLNGRPEPTKPQILAGNAKLGHLQVGPLDISIENPDGSVREDKHNEPPQWRTEMQGAHYGYVKGTVGRDKDHVDVFVAAGTPQDYAGPVYVVNQIDPKTGRFDEHKAVLGAASEQEASDLYHRHYEEGWKGAKSIVTFPSVDAFNAWVKDGAKTKPAEQPAAEGAPAISRLQRNEDGTLAVTGDTKALKDKLAKAGITRVLSSPTGVVVGRTQAEKAHRLLQPQEPKPLAVGTTPGDALPVTVKDGIVHIGAHEAINFETGDPVRVADGATHEDVRQALKDAGALSRRQKFFGDAVARETSSDVEAAAHAREQSKPFYSALSREVDGINAKAQPAAGWLSQIQGLVKAGKVKADEVEWTGLSDWLNLQDGKVTKEAVQQFLRDNGVQVHEVTHGEPSERVPDVKVVEDGKNAEFPFAIMADGVEVNRIRTRQVADEEADALRTDPSHRALYRLNSTQRDTRKYGQYTLPGGENYREVLLTLPAKKFEVREPELRKNARGMWAWFDGERQITGAFEDKTDAERVQPKTPEMARRSDTNYRSQHWDEPNVLAHVRLTDRTDADGKRVLFVEELQSDWAQEGRKKGFAPKDVKNPTDAEVRDFFGLRDGADPAEYRQEMIDRLRKRDADGTVPRAPFVESTDKWLPLALKRIVKMAADEGYDRVAFVNGRQSADRYDLSKHVDTVLYDPSTGTVIGRKDGGNVLTHTVQHSDEVADVVGKDVAKKLLESPKNGYGMHEVSGVDLKLGGEGMRGFYDHIVPAAVNKLLPKIGGEKLGAVRVPVESGMPDGTPRYDYASGAKPGEQAKGPWVVLDFAAVGKPKEVGSFATKKEAAAEVDRLNASTKKMQEQPGFDITPAMRAHAAEGLPLFKRDTTPGARMSVDDVRSVVDGITGKWENGPKIVVVPSYRDLPGGAPSDVKGMYSKGTAYVVASRMKDAQDVGRVVAHEVVAHHGLRDMLGRDGWTTLMGQIKLATDSGNTQMQRIQAEVRAAYRDAKGRYYLTPNLEADEIAAKVVEQAVDANGNFRPGFGFVKAVYAKLAQFLRDHGINVKFTASELHGMLVLAQKNLEAGKRAGGGGQVLVAAARGDEQAQRHSRDNAGMEGDWPELQDALRRYNETFELTGPDLLKEVERLVEDGEAPESLREAIDNYRAEIDEDLRQWGGRGDLDGVEQSFVGAVERAAAGGPGFESPAHARGAAAAGGREERDAEKAAMPPKPPGRPALAGAADFARNVLHEGQMFFAPMGAGVQKARAVAQKFANSMRDARIGWQRMDRILTNNYTAEQRKAMWEAADEENVERTRQAQDANYQRPEGRGLERLNPAERAVVERLHAYGEDLLQRAKDVGMFEGEGLPYWTPRMAVMIGEDGEVSKIPADYSGPRMVTDGTGRNVSTNSPNLKQRKYLTTEETEAAATALAQQKGGARAEVVRDIRTMPLAMSRLERAIAGRELINQIKAVGLATGEDIVSSTMKPGYVMIANPAFTTYRPRFTIEDGRTVPATDQNGDMVFDAHPLFIRRDWEGPLKAVLSTNDGEIYKAYMLVKSKAMSSIMFSPLIHNLVVWGRALSYSPTKVGSSYLYWKGWALDKDNDFVRQAVKDGVVPIGGNRTSGMDTTDLAGNVEKLGRWGDPNESWVNLSAQKLGNWVHAGLGDKTKAGMDAMGDFWHHTLLWQQIQHLQWGIYADAKQALMAKGLSDSSAGTLAAHYANRYAGVVASENQGELARKAMNILLFSRSFNLTNIGLYRDALFGLPDGLKAQLYENAPKAEADRAVWMARRKAAGALVFDLGFAIIATSLVQNLVDYLKKEKTTDEIARGYIDRLQQFAQGIKERPLDPLSYSPYQLSATGANEPGKKDRVDFGEDVNGRHQFMRLPTGKAIEDIIGWVMHPADTFSSKTAPLPKGVWQVIENDKGFGIPVRDPNGSWYKALWESTAHILKSQMPADAIKQLYQAEQGTAEDIDKKKLVGNVTGFTFSQGHPGGPEAAVAAQTNDRFEATKKYTMQFVKEDLKRGDQDAAIDRMVGIGMSTPEIRAVLKRAESQAAGLPKVARERFERRANDAERREMDQQMGR